MNYPKRKNLRLSGYDYSWEGAYFITVCTNDRVCTLAKIAAGDAFVRSQVVLTELGKIAESVLCDLAVQYGMHLDGYVIMPNHIHFILRIEEGASQKRITAGRFVGSFKSVVFNRWKKVSDSAGTVTGKLWQRDFYDHIIRNEADHLEKLKYISENPDKWSLDDLYTDDR